MEKVKNHPRIEVKTLPNGYSLEFDGMKQHGGFMYFNREKLLEGFMVHIGLEMTDQLNTEIIQDFIEAACTWKDNKKCVKEINRLTEELRIEKSRNDRLSKKLMRMQEELKKSTKTEVNDDYTIETPAPEENDTPDNNTEPNKEDSV